MGLCPVSQQHTVLHIKCYTDSVAHTVVQTQPDTDYICDTVELQSQPDTDTGKTTADVQLWLDAQ